MWRLLWALLLCSLHIISLALLQISVVVLVVLVVGRSSQFHSCSRFFATPVVAAVVVAFGCYWFSFLVFCLVALHICLRPAWLPAGVAWRGSGLGRPVLQCNRQAHLEENSSPCCQHSLSSSCCSTIRAVLCFSPVYRACPGSLAMHCIDFLRATLSQQPKEGDRERDGERNRDAIKSH